MHYFAMLQIVKHYVLLVRHYTATDHYAEMYPLTRVHSLENIKTICWFRNRRFAFIHLLHQLISLRELIHAHVSSPSYVHRHTHWYTWYFVHKFFNKVLWFLAVGVWFLTTHSFLFTTVLYIVCYFWRRKYVLSFSFFFIIYSLLYIFVRKNLLCLHFMVISVFGIWVNTYRDNINYIIVFFFCFVIFFFIM